METSQEIKKYYDELADQYDQDRFENSYGQYIHTQEMDILLRWSTQKSAKKSVDLACGTGRFMEFAGLGIDISERMILEAQRKHPHKSFKVADAARLPISKGTFNNALCFHLFMHLNEEKFREILKEVHRILPTGGAFIWDIPSKNRRKRGRRKSTSWHGSYALDLVDIDRLVGDHWHIVNCTGVAMFPIHRIPKKWRPALRKLDSLLCRSFLKSYASYLVIEMTKK